MQTRAACWNSHWNTGLRRGKLCGGRVAYNGSGLRRSRSRTARRVRQSDVTFTALAVLALLERWTVRTVIVGRIPSSRDALALLPSVNRRDTALWAGYWM